jgi:hypothetical protein
MNLKMSVVEDLRKVLQDFLAPEMRAVAARLDALEKRMESQDKIAEARHNEIMVRIESLRSSFEIDKRIERLENRQPS